MNVSPVFLRDLAERAIATYAQTFIGLLLVSTTIDVGAIEAAAVAAIPAALSVVKSYLAERYAPGTVSPASLAKR